MKRIFLLLVLLTLLLVSCSKDKAPEKPLEEKKEDLPVSEEVVPDPEITVPDEEEKEPDVDPTLTEISLTTGLPCTPEAYGIRPIAVMINNNKVSYPQESVSKADIIYECDMEGGVTRLMAIYSQWQQLGNIGSMRSARSYFVDLADSHEAIYIHAGGSPSAYTKIKETEVDNIDGVNMNYLPSNTFWRDKDRIRQCGYEHSMMTSGSKLEYAIDFMQYPTAYYDPDSYKFNSEFIIPSQGEPAEKITLEHSDYITVEFTYDPKTSRYLKQSFGSEHMDGSNGVQLAFENVIVLYVSEKVVDDEGRLDLDLTGEGNGYYFTGGKAYHVGWSREREGELFFISLGGKELKLNPGKTHITLFNKNNSKNVIIE